MMSPTMRAAVLHEVSGPMAVHEIEQPVPGAGELLVEVDANGVNPLDVKIRGGAASHA